MTRPRTTYQYASQTVSSPDGELRFAFTDEDDRALSLHHGSRVHWSEAVGRLSPKQLFVGDDGRTAVIDAADHVTVRAPDGHVLAKISLLDEWSDPSERMHGLVHPQITVTTAGPGWDDYVAAGFLHVEGTTRFVIDGRGGPPLVLDPATLARVDTDPGLVRDAQRAHAGRVLTEALHILVATATRDRSRTHAYPWRLAAVGWARLAGQTAATDAIPTLESLANLDMHITGMSFMSGCPQPDDPIAVDRYALDPLRQASQTALLRMRHAGPARATMQLSRRRRWFSSDWVELDHPPGWTEALTHIATNTLPTEWVERVGPPSHVTAQDGRAVWSHDYLAADGPRTIEVRWGKRGVERVTELPTIPEPTPRERFG